MTLVDLETKLDGLHRACERIGANLLELELDSRRELLEGIALEGESAARWSAASATLLELWRRHGLLQELLERADALRGKRGRLPDDRKTKLEQLLRGPSVVLTPGSDALEQRALLGTSRGTVRSTPDDLLSRMAADFDEVTATLAELAGAFGELTPRVAACGNTLREAAARAAGAESDALEAACRRHAALTALLARDPMAVAEEDVGALETTAAALMREATAVAELRDGVDERLARGRELLGAVERAGEEALDARAETLAKILEPDVSEPPAVAELATGLARVERLTQARRWREAYDELVRWTRGAEAALDRSRAVAAANRAPVEARNQLRGRLDAYHAKARSLRLIEAPGVAELHEQAQRVLFEAPTDLARADELVARYQRALSARPATTGEAAQ
jgi:hypothetical protein